MKKILSIFILVITFIWGASAQKHYESVCFDIDAYTNEFGEKTNTEFACIAGVGYFSNSATTNSKSYLYIYYDELHRLYSSFYTYDTKYPPFDELCRITYKGKTTGEVIAIYTHGSKPYKKKYIDKIITLFEENDECYIWVEEIGDYATTEATFVLYDCKEFANNIKDVRK